jgi:hypothetical protein
VPQVRAGNPLPGPRCAGHKASHWRAMRRIFSLNSLPHCVLTTSTQVAAAREAQRRSAWGVARQMVAREGWSSLWRGTGASLLVAAPTVGVYYPLYDVLSSSFNAVGVPTALAPALAGGLARSAVVISLGARPHSTVCLWHHACT